MQNHSYKQMKGFSGTEALRFGWTTMNNNIVFFIGILVIAGLMLYVFDFVVESAVLSLFNRFDEYGMPYLSDFVSRSSLWDVSKFIAGLFVGEQSAARHVSKSIAETLGGISALLVINAVAFLLLCILIRMWLIKISLRFCDNEKVRYSDLFSCFTLYIRVLLGCLLYLLIVFLGICLFLIPGIIWAIKFRFFACLIVDKGLTPIKAFKKSWAITRGVKWRLVIFFVVLGLINVLGAFCFGVGLFATIPTTTLAMAFTYRRLLSEAEAASTLQAWPRLTRRKLVALVVVFGMFAIFSYVILCHEVETSCINQVRWVCQSNLEKIIKAIDMYRQDHGGSLPPDLNTLCIASYLEEKNIHCPSAISGKSARYEYIRVGPGEAGKYSRGAEKIPDASYRS